MTVGFIRLFLRDARVLAGLAAGLLVVLPILAAHHLNVVDGPGHVARLAVLRDAVLNGQPSPFYDVTSFFLPNVAFDLIGLALAWLTGPETAGRIFLGLSLVLTVSGIAVLNRVAIGRWSVIALAGAFVACNLVIVQGFLNFAFGLALVPWAVALRLRLEGSRWGFAAGAGAGLVLLFCHLFDFGLYAAMSFGLAVAAWRGRRITRGQFVLWLSEAAPALLLLALMPHDSSTNLQFESVIGKLTGIAKSVSSGSIAADIAFLSGMAFLAALLAFFARVRIAASLVPGIAVLAVLYLVLPSELGHGSYVDKRLPIAAAMFLIAALDARIRWTAASRALAALVALAFVVKQGALAAMWHRVDPAIEAAVTAMEALPRGAVIFRAECRPAESALDSYRTHQPAMTHLPALATLDGTRFSAGTWAIAGQQPIAVRPEYGPAYDLQTGIPWSVCRENALRRVVTRIAALADGHPHYLFVIRPEHKRSMTGEATLVAIGEGFELYRVESANPQTPA